MKRAIVNFSTPGGWYPNGQIRLEGSLIRHGYKGETYIFNDANQFDSPTHQDVPYGFKPYALEYLRLLGFTQVLWLDASMRAVRPLDDLWAWLDEHGTVMEEAGHWCGNWANDNCLKNLELTRDEAMTIPMYSAGMTGLDFRSTRAEMFLKEWLHQADIGSFNGKWDNKDGSQSADSRCKGHRHDMIVASVLAKKHGFRYITGGTFLSYIGEVYAEPKPSSIFHLQPAI